MRWLVALWLLLVPATAFAQAAAGTPNQPIFPQTANRGVWQFTSSSTAGTYATLYTAGAKGSICKAIWMDNNDTVTHLVTLQIVNSSTKYGGTTLTTVANAGWGGSPSTAPQQSLMAPYQGSGSLWPGLPLDQNGNPYLYLINGDTLQATFATSITSGDVINLHAMCSDF
jgi:hypothetical protein